MGIEDRRESRDEAYEGVSGADIDSVEGNWEEGRSNGTRRPVRHTPSIGTGKRGIDE